ncbi:MAG: serine/threonine protein kinase, partial [Actinomycetes bacterium]
MPSVAEPASAVEPAPAPARSRRRASGRAGDSSPEPASALSVPGLPPAVVFQPPAAIGPAVVEPV